MSEPTPDPATRPSAGDTADATEAVLEGAGLFHLPDRGLLEVSGSDARRWLNGMVSNDVATLEPGPDQSGCYAMLLTPQGRIIADLHVLLRPGERFWLELARASAEAVRARLDRYIIADDVALRDCSAQVEQLAVEGPRAAAVVEATGVSSLPAPDSGIELELGGVPVTLAAFGLGGGPAFRILAPAGRGESVVRALLEAGAPHGLVLAGRDALEVLRIETGAPLLGVELDESVLPDEAGLERAVSTTKGCYTGQEVVARIRSQGQVGHRLVGFTLAGDELPEPGAGVSVEGRKVGEVTSSAHSPRAGAIALGFVRRAQATPGTRVRVGALDARVAALPFSPEARRRRRG